MAWFILGDDIVPSSVSCYLPRTSDTDGGAIFWKRAVRGQYPPGTPVQDGVCFAPAPFRRRQDAVVQWGPPEDPMLAVAELEAVLRVLLHDVCIIIRMIP